MNNEENIEFWIFALDDPELQQFYATQADNVSMYYAVYIQQCAREPSPKEEQILHLRNECILLIDYCLVPVYYSLPLKGYIIIMTDAFCKTEETKTLLRLRFFHSSPEGLIDIGAISDEQKKCMHLLLEEYEHACDDLQPAILRNLIFNILLFSPTGNYNVQLKSGHILRHALQFMELVDQYAFRHKKKAFYAGEIGITEKMLTHVLRVTYQKTFREIITCQALIEGTKKLVFTNKSVTRIANELNYDASAFNKLFLKWKGVSPTDLRSNYRKYIHHA